MSEQFNQEIDQRIGKTTLYLYAFGLTCLISYKKAFKNKGHEGALLPKRGFKGAEPLYN